MAFLVGLARKFITLIGPVFLNWAWGKFSEWRAARAKKAEDEKKNKEAREKLEKAKTPEEIDDAAKDIASKF